MRKITRRSLLALPLVAAAAGLPAGPAYAGGGCGEAITAGSTTTVRIAHACFSPTIVKVPVGGTVKWENRSGMMHNLSSPGGWFVDQLNDSQSYSRRFTAAGLYPYACTIHIGMSGVVAVGDTIAAPATADNGVDLGVKDLGAQVGADTAAEAEAGSKGAVDAVKGTDTQPVSDTRDGGDSGSGTPVAGWIAGGALALLAALLAVGVGRRSSRHPAEAA